MARRRRVFDRYTGQVNIPDEDRIAFTPYQVWKAKMTKVPVQHKIIAVKCMGKMHKIHMRFPGRITLLNHPDRRGEVTMMKLGGDKPECLQFLEKWKEIPANVAQTRPWVRVYLKARQEWAAHRGTEKKKYQDWLDQPFYERLGDWVSIVHIHLQGMISKFSKGKYRHSNQNWIGTARRYVDQPGHGDYIQPRVKLSFEKVESGGKGDQD